MIFSVVLSSIPSTMSVYTPFQNGFFQGKFSAKKSKILITWLFNCYPHSPAPPASLTTPSPGLRLPHCFPSVPLPPAQTHINQKAIMFQKTVTISYLPMNLHLFRYISSWYVGSCSQVGAPVWQSFFHKKMFLSAARAAVS